MENVFVGLFSVQALMSAGLIFILRVMDMSLDTLRVLYVMRGRKAVAWGLGFFQALIFVLAIGSVINDLENPPKAVFVRDYEDTVQNIKKWIEKFQKYYL